MLRQDVEVLLPNLEANLRLGIGDADMWPREVGYLTQLSLTIITELLEGACGKMIQAPAGSASRDFWAGRQGGRRRGNAWGESLKLLRLSKHEVLEPSYRWPRPTLGRKQLKEQGLNCSEGPVVQVGLDVIVGTCEVGNGDMVGALDMYLGSCLGGRRRCHWLLSWLRGKSEVQHLRMGQRSTFLRGLRPSHAL